MWNQLYLLINYLTLLLNFNFDVESFDNVFMSNTVDDIRSYWVLFIAFMKSVIPELESVDFVEDSVDSDVESVDSNVLSQIMVYVS